jgi:hypothetical protein
LKHQLGVSVPAIKAVINTRLYICPYLPLPNQEEKTGTRCLSTPQVEAENMVKMDNLDRIVKSNNMTVKHFFQS